MQISKDILNIILEYDGQIKYRKGVYVNIIIKKNDYRYNLIKPFINKN